MQHGFWPFYQNTTVAYDFFEINILNDLLFNHFDLKFKKNQSGSYQKPFYLYLITEEFVKFLHVCSIPTMKPKSFQFETQHK